MRVNVCVNGTFRYPHYIRHYAESGALGAFFYAHRRATRPAGLGIGAARGRNTWWKEYLLQAAHRWAPGAWAAAAAPAVGDLWQSDVIRHWRDCDSVEAVIGGVADRVLAHARARGCRILGHPVTSHPDSMARLVGQAYADLGLDPRRAAMPGLARRRAEIALCDRLVVDSTAVARSFEQAGIPRDQIVRITPGVDLARFHPPLSPGVPGVFRAVCIGTITPRKGQHVLLRAWADLHLPAAELVLVGTPGRHAGAVTRGFGGAFTHIRHIPQAALPDYLATAAVVVMPSVEDGFAQAPLEAMACGVPVVVTANVGMADLIEDGVNGFVVPPFDAASIAARIETLYRDRDRATAMGQAAAATARRVGSWAAYVDRVLAEHRRLVGEAPVPAAAA